jgi:hypothetical protein
MPSESVSVGEQFAICPTTAVSILLRQRDFAEAESFPMS